MDDRHVLDVYCVVMMAVSETGWANDAGTGPGTEMFMGAIRATTPHSYSVYGTV